MLSRKIALTVATALASLLAICSTASAAPVIDGQFPLASAVDTNTKIAAGPDGNIWVAVHGEDNDVARVTPTGQVEEFELKEIENPSGIAAGPEGKMWVTATNKVASFSPSDPKESSKAFTVLTVDTNSPIVAGPDGQMWFAASDEVDHFAPSDPEGATPIAVPELSPRDIDVAGSLIVVADAGKPRIVTLTTAGVVQPDIVIGHKNNSKTGGRIAGRRGRPDSGPDRVLRPGEPVPRASAWSRRPTRPRSSNATAIPFGVAYGSDGAFWIPLFGGGRPARGRED